MQLLATKTLPELVTKRCYWLKDLLVTNNSILVTNIELLVTRSWELMTNNANIGD